MAEEAEKSIANADSNDVPEIRGIVQSQEMAKAEADAKAAMGNAGFKFLQAKVDEIHKQWENKLDEFEKEKRAYIEGQYTKVLNRSLWSIAGAAAVVLAGASWFVLGQLMETHEKISDLYATINSTERAARQSRETLDAQERAMRTANAALNDKAAEVEKAIQELEATRAQLARERQR